MKQSKPKLRLATKSSAAQLSEQPLFATNPEVALPLLSMIGQAQLSIDDLLGQLSRSFLEQLLVLSAQSVAGAKHPGRQSGDVRWHGAQGGVVALGHSKLQLKRPRLRSAKGEVAVPAYAALARDGELSRRIADILVCKACPELVEGSAPANMPVWCTAALTNWASPRAPCRVSLSNKARRPGRSSWAAI